MRFVLFIGAIVLLTSCAQNNYVKFGALYEQNAPAAVPDYSNLNDWAAHPDKKDPSDSLPVAIRKLPTSKPDVDVFFLYPTSYLDHSKPTGINASLVDSRLNIYTDFSSILNQASIFNEAGRVFSPRYRQANIDAYYPITPADTIQAIAAFELAYQDIRKAFVYYLNNENKGRPIVIAAHSQGSTHAIRLLKEFFDNKPLANQLVAAYVVGMAIDPAQYTQLKACTTPNETGCICAWRTYLEGYTPPFVEKEKFKSIVTNPISWDTVHTKMDRFANEGSVLYNFRKITKHVAGAENHDGILWTKKPRFMGSFLYKTKNYHVADYNFYYLSVRKNVSLRVNNYLSKLKETSR
jgi:hypothetical protein